MELPESQYINMRPILGPIFLKAGINIENYSSGTLVHAFGITPSRRAHDALNDMRNLLDAIRELKIRVPKSFA